LGFLGSLFSSSVFLLLRGLLERDGFDYGHQGLFFSVFLLLGCWFFLGLLSKYEKSLEIGVLCFVSFEQFGFIYSGLLLQLYLLRERIDLFSVLLIV